MPFRYVSRRSQLIRSYYAGIGKTAVILPAAFLVSIALSMLMLGMVFYLKETYGATGRQVGVCIALWVVAYIAGCMLLRPRTDSVRPRYLIAVSTLCMGLSALGILHASSFGLATVAFCLTGLSTSLFWPSMMSWMSSNLEGAELSRTMSHYNMAWSSGTIIGPTLGGWLSQIHPSFPLYGYLLLALATFLMIVGAMLALPKVRADTYSATGNGKSPAEDHSGTLLRYVAWVGLFSAFFAMGVVNTVFPLSAISDLHISKSLVGVLLTVRTTVTTIGFILMGRFVFWHNRGSQMLLGTIGLAGIMVIMGHVNTPWALSPVFAILGILVAMGYFNSLFHGIERSSNRAARSAIHESLLGVGLASGAFFGGLIYQEYDAGVVYRTCVAVALVGTLAQGVLILWIKHQESPPRPEGS